MVSEKSQLFFDDLQFGIVLIVLVGVILIAVIGAVCWLLLRPLQSTVFSATHNVSQMAKALRCSRDSGTLLQRQEDIAQQLADLSEQDKALGSDNRR